MVLGGTAVMSGAVMSGAVTSTARPGAAPTRLRRLPVPRAGQWDWQRYAACRGTDTATFYHPDNERGGARIRRERQAKQICRRCPVRAECLRWALASHEPYGVWGGLSAEERTALTVGRSA